MVENKKLFSGLEILRFVCAVSVVVWHYQHFFMVAPGQLAADFRREAQPFYAQLSFLYAHGDNGVSIFFAISGFIFFWKYREGIRTGRVNWWRFFVLRFSRLYPLHFATLLFVAAAQWLYIYRNGFSFVYPYNDTYHFILNLFFASYWGLQNGYSFDAPVWSVSLEVIAYTVFFVAARFIRLSLIETLGILIFAYAAERLLGSHDLFNCLRYFFLGGSVYLIVQKTESIRVTYRLPPLVIVTLSSGYIFLVAAGKTQAFSLALFTAGIVALFAVLETHLRETAIPKVAPFFGNLTYSSYLCHFPIQLTCVLITDALMLNRDVYLHPATFLAFIIGTLVISHFVYQFFEAPAQARIRKVFSLKTQIERVA
jgi:peptidoglycan/LPS O-acetylase OafA/YrhL